MSSIASLSALAATGGNTGLFDVRFGGPTSNGFGGGGVRRGLGGGATLGAFARTGGATLAALLRAGIGGTLAALARATAVGERVGGGCVGLWRGGPGSCDAADAADG